MLERVFDTGRFLTPTDSEVTHLAFSSHNKDVVHAGAFFLQDDRALRCVDEFHESIDSGCRLRHFGITNNFADTARLSVAKWYATPGKGESVGSCRVERHRWVRTELSGLDRKTRCIQHGDERRITSNPLSALAQF